MSTSVSNVKLDLCREQSTDLGIRGRLFYNQVYLCDTVEPPFRPKYGAIPAGDYPVVMCWSAKFQRYLPVLVGVPGRSGIEFHPGNNPLVDSRGCILPGYAVEGKCQVIHSKIFTGILCSNLAQANSIELFIHDLFI